MILPRFSSGHGHLAARADISLAARRTESRFAHQAGVHAPSNGRAMMAAHDLAMPWLSCGLVPLPPRVADAQLHPGTRQAPTPPPNHRCRSSSACCRWCALSPPTGTRTSPSPSQSPPPVAVGLL